MPTDHDLVRATLLGDRHAAEELLLRHTPALRREAWAGAWQLGPDGDPEDLLQEFYTRVCSRGFRALALWHGLTDPDVTTIEPYFTTILRNLLRDAGRRRRVRPDREPLDDDEDEPVEPVDTGDGPEDTAVHLQLRQAMAQCIATVLNVKQRQIIALHLEDKSHAEIAAIMGVTAGNSRVLLTRALAALKACMEARHRNVRRGGAVLE